jgi:hypothetical protein
VTARGRHAPAPGPVPSAAPASPWARIHIRLLFPWQVAPSLALSLWRVPLLAVMIGFCSVHCRLALTAGDGLDWMLTVKVSREKDVDLLLAAC